MEVWLLNNLGTLALAVVVIGGVFFFAVVGSALVRRGFPRLLKGEHNDMVGVVLGMYGTIYGIFLAFVIVAELQGLDTAGTVVASEATHAAEIVRGASAFPAAERKRLTGAVGEYIHAVVDTQWPLMREGKADGPRTEDALAGIYKTLQDYEPVTESEKAYYAQSATALDGLVGDRRARLTIAAQELPALLKVLVYGGALIMIPLTFLYGVVNRKAQLMFVGSVSVLIGVTLLLSLALARPFAGDLGVQPAPFKEGALAQFWK